MPALFEGLGEGAPERGVTCLPGKQAGLSLPDPTLTDPENWTLSCFITGHLAAALMGQVDFRTADYSACLREGQMAVRWRSTQLVDEALASTIAGNPVHGARSLQRARKTGACLTVHPSTVNGNELGVQEWRDSLFLSYGLEPPDLPRYCNGCNAKYTIFHTLTCKRGGLVTAIHNELRDRVADLAGKTFTPSHVRDDLLIFAG